MAKRPVPLYDFKAFGAAIKAARNEYGESRKKVSDELYISPRYLANIEQDAGSSSLPTRTTFRRKSAYSGGFSAFFILLLRFGRLLFSGDSRNRKAVSA